KDHDIPQLAEARDAQPARVSFRRDARAVHDHAEGRMRLGAGPFLYRAHQSGQGHPAAGLRGDLEIATVDHGTLAPVRQGQPPARGAQRAQDGTLMLDDETRRLSDGAEEARVIVAVRDAEEAPRPERVGELRLEGG